MIAPFILRSTLGRSYNVDLDDSKRTKKALKRIGYFEEPNYGLTEFPDELLFEGIENFQRDQGLRRDGVMKPGGETATALGRVLGEVEQRRIGNKRQPTKERAVLGLFDEVGSRSANQSRDISSTKQALAWAGHFPRDRSRTDDERHDNDLFDAIKRFQKSAGLKVDGWMRPYGETERELDRQIAPRVFDARKPDAASEEDLRDNEQQETAAIAIPPIVYKIAEFFGMAVMAAWAWWQAMSSLEREKVRRQVEDGDSGDSIEERCKHLHYEIDIPTCNEISDKRGAQAAQRCFATANVRYAACLRGVPLDELPPLDTWNN